METSMPNKTGYRVDLFLLPARHYVEYTSLKRPVTREMAESLGNYLRRQSASGRIIDVATGEIIKEWYPIDSNKMMVFSSELAEEHWKNKRRNGYGNDDRKTCSQDRR